MRPCKFFYLPIIITPGNGHLQSRKEVKGKNPEREKSCLPHPLHDCEPHSVTEKRLKNDESEELLTEPMCGIVQNIRQVIMCGIVKIGQ